MPRVRYTDPAERDLEDIWLHIARDDAAAADRWLRALSGTFDLLAARPGIGSRRDHLGPNLRSHAHGRYIVFYRPCPGGIEVVRVLHGSRDIGSTFAE